MMMMMMMMMTMEEKIRKEYYRSRSGLSQRVNLMPLTDSRQSTIVIFNIINWKKSEIQRIDAKQGSCWCWHWQEVIIQRLMLIQSTYPDKKEVELTKSEYIHRHNKAASSIHWNISKQYKYQSGGQVVWTYTGESNRKRKWDMYHLGHAGSRCR